MNIKSVYAALIILLLGTCHAHSQERGTTEFFIDFRVNITQIDSSYRDNAVRLSELSSFLKNLQTDKTIDIVSVSFCGAASPEGSYEWNRKLAAGRLKSLEKLVRSGVDIPDSLVTYNDSYIPWEYLAARVAESDMPYKDEILSIISDSPEIVAYHSGRTIDRRILKLQKLNSGRVWKEMLRRFFIPMRNACAVFVTYRRVPVPGLEAPACTLSAPASGILSPAPPVPEKWGRNLYVKTNALGLGLAISNAAVEIDLCRHLSFNLPAYYSAWNYFTPTVKFRTFAVQPELRYWFSDGGPCNDGWFAGAHFGLAYYNLAVNGAFRTQDHDGKSPALGGGLAAGYRMPISGNGRWKMEFSLGAGAYALHHDKFRNHTNGLLSHTEKRTYVGIDQASVSVSYTFGLNRKGGAR